MTRFLGILPAFALIFATGCGDPPDEGGSSTYWVRGKLIRNNGDPASVTVHLLRDGQKISEFETDEQGAYEFKIKPSQTTDGALGTAVKFGLRSTLTVTGQPAVVALDFTVNDASLSLPTVRFLEAQLSLNVTSEDVQVTVPNYRPGDNNQPAAGFDVEVRTQSDNYLVTKSGDSGVSVIAVPLPLIEDYPTTWRLHARLSSASNYTGFVTGPPGELTPQNPAPLSRNASCVYSTTADQTGTTLSPCPITDGNLASTIDPSSAICVDPDPDDNLQECASTWERLVVDLGAVESISAVAIHEMGDAASLLLERSDDGTQYTSITSVSIDSFLFTTPFSAQYLRISYSGDLTQSQLAGLNEIVVY